LNTRRSFENIFLTLIFLIIFYYFVAFILSFFKDIDISLPSLDTNISFELPNINIDTDYLLNKYLNKDKNVTNEINVIKTSIKNNIIKENKKMYTDDSTVFKITQYTQIKNKPKIKSVFDNNKTIMTNLMPTVKKKKEIKSKKESIKKVIPIKKKVTLNKNPKKISRKIMLDALSQFIKSTIIDIRANAKLISSNTNDSIKIRLTVLKNGNYQNVKYLSGNNTLLNNAKVVVKKAFPRKLNPLIQSQFPRYIRFKIKFGNN